MIFLKHPRVPNQKQALFGGTIIRLEPRLYHVDLFASTDVFYFKRLKDAKNFIEIATAARRLAIRKHKRGNAT